MRRLAQRLFIDTLEIAPSLESSKCRRMYCALDSSIKRSFDPDESTKIYNEYLPYLPIRQYKNSIIQTANTHTLLTLIHSDLFIAMKSFGLSFIATLAFLGATAMANPIADLTPNSVEGALAYKITCSGGLTPASKCTNGQKKNGCRCDSVGTYLCDRSSDAKSGGDCAKCGCEKI